MPAPIITGPIPNPDGTNTTVTTKTTFHSNGSTKSTDRVVLDPDDEIVKRDKETFKKGTGPGANGDKKTSFTSNADLSASPPKRVTVNIKYCPDGTTEKTKITRVYYKPENRWHEETRERKKVKRDCETGEVIALAFPHGSGDYVLVASALAVLIFSVLGWTNNENIYWLLAMIALIAVAIFYGRHLRAKSDQELSMYIELYDAMLDTDELPDFIDNAIEEEPPEPEW